MYRFIINIFLVACFALPAWGEDIHLQIDSTFYYNGVPKEDLAEVVESWLHSRKDMAWAFALKDCEDDRIIFSGIPSCFSNYVSIKHLLFAAASDNLYYSFQIAVRDGVVRIWFTDFSYRSYVMPQFVLCVERPKSVHWYDKPIYKRVMNFALKTYPARIASLHEALENAFRPYKIPIYW